MHGTWLKRLLLLLASAIAALSLLELVCHHYLQYPGHPPASAALAWFLRAAYLSNRDVIQYDRECARYDEELIYTLRPGTCVFLNAEFRHTVRINSMGLRDDEASLRKPQVIILGDSHAMGWGVEEGRTFASLLENATGLRTLDAGISSYGTVREMSMLRRLDTGAVRVLVVQYCDNDRDENEQYVRSGALPKVSRSRYDRIAEDVERSKRYVPGQYLARILEAHLLRKIVPGPAGDRALLKVHAHAPARRGDEAALFLQVLRGGPPVLHRVPILLIEIDGRGVPNGRFLEGIREYAREGVIARMGFRIRPIDLSGRLKPEHFFTIDDHLNASGHRVVAEELSRAIRMELRASGVVPGKKR